MWTRARCSKFFPFLSLSISTILRIPPEDAHWQEAMPAMTIRCLKAFWAPFLPFFPSEFDAFVNKSMKDPLFVLGAT